MKIPHDKFCVLPWISLEASPIGTVRPCCLADDEIVDNSGQKFMLNSADFSHIQNSDYMIKLRGEFLNGQQPKTCRKCWNEESAGRTSKRMHTLDRLKHSVSETSWTQDAKPLMFLDLKLGNICNLKCRICGSWSSSQFATEEIQAADPARRKQTFAYQMLQAGSWPRHNESFWKEIDRSLQNIRYIEFTGGEPFLIDQHFDMLQGIVDRGIAGRVEIHYNTNGTVWPDRGPAIWKHFRTVEIAFSIDDLEQRFEYQRTNAVWSDVVNNIAQFKNLRSQHNNIKLQCCSTVNVFNVFYLNSLADWILKQEFDFVYWNVMHDAWYFSVASLPLNVKHIVQNRLLNASIPEQWQKDFVNIVGFMNQGQSTDGHELKKQIKILDQRRNQNLIKVMPELAQAISYEI